MKERKTKVKTNSRADNMTCDVVEASSTVCSVQRIVVVQADTFYTGCWHFVGLRMLLYVTVIVI